MPNYLFTIPASDACIRFMLRYPAAISHFANGEPPKPKSLRSKPSHSLPASLGVDLSPLPVPPDWPTTPAEMESEIHHRNVELYHIVLNGTPELVTGAGCIFQTWMSTTHTAIDMSGHGEQFAFLSPQLPELASLFDGITKDALAERLRMYLLRRGEDARVTQSELDTGWDDIRIVGDQARECADKGLGLIWLTV